jgi:hypothetical protein
LLRQYPLGRTARGGDPSEPATLANTKVYANCVDRTLIRLDWTRDWLEAAFHRLMAEDDEAMLGLSLHLSMPACTQVWA